MSELQIMMEHLDKACCPEEIFGSGDDPGVVFRKLARACHPDRYPADVTLAQQVFQKLNDLKQVADQRVKDGKWGKRIPLPHCTPMEIGKYKAKPNPHIGDIADLYTVSGGKKIIKVARNHDDNDLMRAEAEALKTLKNIDKPVDDGVPRLLDNFWVEGTWKREANVLTAFPGFITAQHVHTKMPKVDARTAVWMFKRLLTLLSHVHHHRLVHGAILPPHVLFYPDNDGNSIMDPRKHSVRLIDWCYSVNYESRTRLSSWVPAWQDNYAPELLQKKYIGPPSDIYMAAMLIRYLAGPLPGALEKVLKKCLIVEYKKRYQKASQVFDEWKEAAATEFGTSKWHPFNIPI